MIWLNNIIDNIDNVFIKIISTYRNYEVTEYSYPETKHPSTYSFILSFIHSKYLIKSPMIETWSLEWKKEEKCSASSLKTL